MGNWFSSSSPSQGDQSSQQQQQQQVIQEQVLDLSKFPYTGTNSASDACIENANFGYSVHCSSTNNEVKIFNCMDQTKSPMTVDRHDLSILYGRCFQKIRDTCPSKATEESCTAASLEQCTWDPAASKCSVRDAAGLENYGSDVVFCSEIKTGSGLKSDVATKLDPAMMSCLEDNWIKK